MVYQHFFPGLALIPYQKYGCHHPNNCLAYYVPLQSLLPCEVLRSLSKLFFGDEKEISSMLLLHLLVTPYLRIDYSEIQHSEF